MKEILRLLPLSCAALLTGGAWTLFALGHPLPGRCGTPLFWGVVLGVLTLFLAYRLLCYYRCHTQKLLFLLRAIENNDSSVHFSEDVQAIDTRLVNSALNRVARILYNVKNETAQKEKYYELILECVNTGILVLNDNGAVYQKNSEVLRLLGLEVFTHVSQLSRVDERLVAVFAACRAGDKRQASFCNERGTVNLSIRVSDISVRNEHLRILALNDINNELNEKEIDSWIRLTRVLTHEIMNAVTPITSLSDTLLKLTEHLLPEQETGEASVPLPVAEVRDEEVAELHSGLQTISRTGKGLLAFVESYRRFTRIPTPEPSLFYVKPFVHRMVELARHQYPATGIRFTVDIVPDELILYADENLIAQVMTNLLKNAIQAIGSDSTASGREPCIGIRARCDEREAVLIEVSNNGPAIPPDIAEHIFIPFFTTKEGGSGIGLSISRQIMRLSGGSLSLTNGQETTFVMRFD